MNIFYLLIGVSLLAALIFLAAFIWAVRNGQFDDDKTPSYRILFDDEPEKIPETADTNNKKTNKD